MTSTHLDPLAAASAGTKMKQVQDAKDMYKVVVERAARVGGTVPDYEFLELIGKGTFGRVYKCKRKSTKEVVAVKIIDVDELDYTLETEQKDEAISDFRKEVKALQHLKDAQAININYIQEAFDLHSQLWIVTDYCPGGSVHTLMKACPATSGLEEQYIIPIARELAIALKCVHEAGIIHRDVKCGNVLISEDGQVQLCDFGVAGVIESDTSKRATIIGTPFWMPPEMHEGMMLNPGQGPGFGTEVDCWAYGCTVFEMATGMPPNHKFNPAMLRTVLKAAPRLHGGEYSQGLRDFVAYCLEEKPQLRPTADQILQHPYIANSSKRYPTASVRQLIDRYMQWERRGGQRASLFNPIGAAAPQPGHEQVEASDDWNFSTTDGFEVDFVKRYSQLGIAETDFALLHSEGGMDAPVVNTHVLSPLEEAKEDAKAKRGEASMDRLFNKAADPYDYNVPVEVDMPISDLPLRNLSSDRAANRETLIDLDMGDLDFQPTFNFDFGDVPTLKAPKGLRLDFGDDEDGDGEEHYYTDQDQDAKRATKDWSFPLNMLASENPSRRTQDWTFATAAQPQDDNINNRRTADWTFATAQPLDPALEAEDGFTFPKQQTEDDIVPGFRPNLTRTATEPIGNFGDYLHPPAQITLTSSDDDDESGIRDSRPMIDLDIGTMPKVDFPFEPQQSMAPVLPNIFAVSPAHSVADSTDTRNNPFFLDDVDRRPEDELKRTSNGSSHRLSRSEPGLLVPGSQYSKMLHSRIPSAESALQQARDRQYSMSSTASSDLEGSAWGHNYNRSIGEHTRTQLVNGLQITAAAPSAWARFSEAGPFDDPLDEAPLHGPSMSVPNLEDSDYPPMRTRSFLRSGSLVNDDTDSSAIGELLIPRNRMRSGTVSTTVTSNGYDSSRDEPAYPPARNVTRVATEFPTLTPPDPAVLEEGADAELIFHEMDRLLGDMQSALSFTFDALQRRDLNIMGRTDEEDEDLDRPFRGFGSEGEAE